MPRTIACAAVGVLLASVVANVCGAQVIGTPAVVLPVIKKSVDLGRAHALEELRATNFKHYLRARAILAAGNEICQPDVPGTFRLRQTALDRFAGDNLQCGTWLTSYPPKRPLSFILDDVRYHALVSVTIPAAALKTTIANPK
jgi:hypothetical protein